MMLLRWFTAYCRFPIQCIDCQRKSGNAGVGVDDPVSNNLKFLRIRNMPEQPKQHLTHNCVQDAACAYEIRNIDETDLATWDSYVLSSPNSTFFHRGGWYRVISRAFGHKPHYLAAMQPNGRIVGILPLFEMKSLLFGHSLVSVPFCVYGGAVADSAAIVRSLEDKAAVLAERLGVDYLELRNIEPTREDWPSHVSHAFFSRDLEEDSEAILKAIDKKQRAVVRKSLKNNLTVEIQDEIDEFFDAYSTSVRNLGTPVFAKDYFYELKMEFGCNCEIVTVKQDSDVHCSLVSFVFKNQVLPYYGGGYPLSRSSKAMDFMYFDLMCRAREKGIDSFDFGRSKIESGAYHYKRHWGFRPRLLHYQYYLVKSRKLPNKTTNNPKYRMMINAWKRLPVSVSRWLGPYLSKYLG